MPRTTPSTNSFRVWVSALVATVVALAVLAALALVAEVDFDGLDQLLVTAYVVYWPLSTGLYVAWSLGVYSRLDPAALKRATDTDDRDERRLTSRILGASGATSTTISAAVVAVFVTIAIAQRPEFGSEAIYVALALLTVASSWVLMVFSFAQGYLRLGAADEPGAHFRFSFPGEPVFSDYLTLAVLISAMAATTPADVTSRAAWRVVRTNVLIAFTFNTVIIAMMVSLLFGGLLG